MRAGWAARLARAVPVRPTAWCGLGRQLHFGVPARCLGQFDVFDRERDIQAGKRVIEGFADDGFLVNDVFVCGPCVVFPKEVFLWDVHRPADITPLSLALVSHYLPRVEVLIIGTGESQVQPPPSLRSALRDFGITLEAMDSRSAVGTFNVLNQEDRKVATALLPLRPYDRHVVERLEH